MENKYEKILTNPDISLNDMCKLIKKPEKLYKFQSFGSEVNDEFIENKYWENNMKGAFHLSLGYEFKDKNDCRPYIDRDFVISELINFLKGATKDMDKIRAIKLGLEKSINNEALDEITDRYQTNICIGCFTERVDNIRMWNEYADLSKGFCIEYDTSQNQLFGNSTLPILYSNTPYDSSRTMINNLILEWTCTAKNRTLEENSKIYSNAYSQVCKTAYIPLFYKGLDYQHEEEYRMFILDHRTYDDKKINKGDIVYSYNNICLKKAITGIYLGENFTQLTNSDKIRLAIETIVEENNLKLYQMKKVKGKLSYTCINNKI
ncbi:DUF2971 domain-containing protein [Clostridium butyricum]|uniref:DUF2971 domain-containing protein n=1 Tax=Clostridium butyricum TaxID=1492 RepID=UPI002AB1130C|nr:DUF2971 domain-containing protein [Clostridium butyricum]